MAKEIIELLEYLKNDSTVTGLFWAYIIGTIIVVAAVIAVFVFVFLQIRRGMKEMDDFPFNRHRK